MRNLFALAIFSGGLSVLAQTHPAGAVATGRPAGVHPATGAGAAKPVPGVRVPPAIASGGFATGEHGANHSPAQPSGQTFSRPVSTFSPPMSTFSRPDGTFSRPDSLFSRSFITTGSQMVIRSDGNGGFHAFVRPGGGHPGQLPGRVPGGPFYSGYRFQTGGSHQGNFQYGAQGYPLGWGVGPNSVIVINSDGQAYWDDGSTEGAYEGSTWDAVPMEGNGTEQSPPLWMTTGANGFSGPQGLPAIVMVPPPRREELVVVDFPPGARVLR